VPAVRRIATAVESRNNLGRGEVLSLLNRETAAGQFPRLVDLVYNSTRLPDLEPPPGVITRSQLESTLRAGLSHLDAYELTAPSFAAAKSLSTADHVLDHLDHEIRSAESAALFGPAPSGLALPPPARHVPPPHHAALAGVAPPTSQRRTNTHAQLHPAYGSVPGHSNHRRGGPERFTA
jgi:hypothetical protein